MLLNGLRKAETELKIQFFYEHYKPELFNHLVDSKEMVICVFFPFSSEGGINNFWGS